MSAIKISIKRELPTRHSMGIPRTTVRVEGEFAYQSVHHPDVEKENIEKLFELMIIENVDFEVD